MIDRERLSDEECDAEFACLFPQGMGGADLMLELAPTGWDASPLRLCFHPTPEQRFDEALRMHRRLAELSESWGHQPPDQTPPPTIEKITRDYVDPPLEPERELAELAGRCVWDVFSDNHEVVTPDGRLLDLGSFRASGGFIADWLNREQGGSKYSYMDFYMGTIWIGGRADLTPVYEAIFRRLKARGHEWVYHFPRLALVDMRPLLESLKPDKPDWEDYDPSKALEQQRESEEHEQQVAEMRASLDESYREAVDKARASPPPETVAAYRNVYDVFPCGWPPELPNL
ncbi:MAG: hypothetical protein HY718_10190 [Planctomycetes bacterium]|nr:hypothetical protein [Planctomycetota bacterium]